MGKITNEEYNKALKNKNFRKIMYSASKNYSFLIDLEELESCRLIGLWEALKHFKPGKGVKFTSYLFERVKYECKKVITYYYKTGCKDLSIKYDLEDKKRSELDLVDIIDNLPDDLKKLVELRYIKGLTYKKIAQKINCSHETVRRKIKQASNLIKKEFY